MRKVMTWRVWVLVAAWVFSLLAISPSPWASGVEVRSVAPGSAAHDAGLSAGEIIEAVNREPVATLAEYKDEMKKVVFGEVSLLIKTDRGDVAYSRVGGLGVIFENTTVVKVEEDVPVQLGSRIMSINGKNVFSSDDVAKIEWELFEEKVLIIQTGKAEYPLLVREPLDITVGEAKKSNINKGLELQGGTRVLLQPVAEGEVSDQDVQDIIDVLGNRLDVYGLADVKVRSAGDLEGNKFVVVEMAGVSQEEIKNVVAKQGKFEAKIGGETVFRGGEEDIMFVCRNDGSCAGIRPPCVQIESGEFSCTFQFAITISEEAAEKHAGVTKDLAVNITEGGRDLEKKIDFYLDDVVVDSLNIGADLKGQPITQISISGPGFGPSEEAAYENAVEQMSRLQTVLITGSLPFKLEVVKLDTISPALGEEFLRNSVLVGIAALVAVTAVIVVRYRRIKIIIPTLITSLSEVFITLGVAALIGWNLDLAAIAGIIAAVGTGVDDQIVITDEVLRGEGRYLNWKEKVKRAFFIILAAYAATVAAMIPLWNAGAGLVRGFAVTTIIGVTIGVLITRPAFASIMESLLEKN